jgi:hypothetical protein
LTSTERWRRFRLRQRGVEPLRAPSAPGPVDWFEEMFGCKQLTLEELYAAAARDVDEKTAPAGTDAA